MQVFTCARAEWMYHSDVTIAQMGNGATECWWRHTPEAHGGFGGFWKRQLVELSSWLRRRQLAFTCLLKPGQSWGGRWKSQNRKNVYLSPYVEEPLNSKVIKCFIPELRSCKCFRILRFLCSMYICYEHFMYISHICIMGMVHYYYYYYYYIPSEFFTPALPGGFSLESEWLQSLFEFFTPGLADGL